MASAGMPPRGRWYSSHVATVLSEGQRPGDARDAVGDGAGRSLDRRREAADEWLIEQVRRGDRAAFGVIVRRYERPLMRHCERIVGGVGAQDAVQETFLCAWSAIRAGVEVRALRAWLFTIAHRKAIAALRDRGRCAAELPEGLSDGRSLVEQVDRSARVRSTFAALAGLPADQREALLASAVHGASGRQIARELGVDEPGVRQLVFRARSALRVAGAAACVPPLVVVRWLRGLIRSSPRSAAVTHGATAPAQAAGPLLKVGVVAIIGAAAAGSAAFHVFGSPHAPARHVVHVVPPVAETVRPARPPPVPARQVRGGSAGPSTATVAVRPSRSRPRFSAVDLRLTAALSAPIVDARPPAGRRAVAAARPRGTTAVVHAGGASGAPAQAGRAPATPTAAGSPPASAPLRAALPRVIRPVNRTVHGVSSSLPGTVSRAVAAVTSSGASAVGDVVHTVTSVVQPVVSTAAGASSSAVQTVQQAGQSAVAGATQAVQGAAGAVASTTSSAAQAAQGAVSATTSTVTNVLHGATGAPGPGATAAANGLGQTVGSLVGATGAL